MVGEKRPRDEDETEHQPAANGSNGVVKHESNAQEIQSVVGNNASTPYGSAGGSSGPVGNIGHGGGGGAGGQDALYIGDLQWVSPSVACSMAHVLRILCSGPLMKTCEPLLVPWA